MSIVSLHPFTPTALLSEITSELSGAKASDLLGLISSGSSVALTALHASLLSHGSGGQRSEIKLVAGFPSH